MPRPSTLSAFTSEQKAAAHDLLATRVAFMMGRKFEEGDWAEVYCRAKGIPNQGWSNLNIDVMYNGLGIEHKMVCYRSKPSVVEACGASRMHPSATRSIRIPTGTRNADKAMRDILTQYGELIEQRRQKVAETSPDGQADMRTGWLLWQETLREFLYFEERMLAPDPDDYFAKWNTASTRGARKSSTNLWIYEKDTGHKRFSITTSAGAKVQPYFDVPAPDDPNLYHFQVQGETLNGERVRLWVTEETARELERILSSLSEDAVSGAILDISDRLGPNEQAPMAEAYAAICVMVSVEAYLELQRLFPDSVSDQHMMQCLVRYLASVS